MMRRESTRKLITENVDAEDASEEEDDQKNVGASLDINETPGAGKTPGNSPNKVDRLSQLQKKI